MSTLFVSYRLRSLIERKISTFLVLKEKRPGWECVSYLLNVKSLSPFSDPFNYMPRYKILQITCTNHG